MKKEHLALLAVLMLMWMAVPQCKADNTLASLVEMDYSGKADTVTTAFLNQFLNTSTGTFWAVPCDRANREDETRYIYWQQAHAMDALIYSYERIKDVSPNTATTYKRYMQRWYLNHANNWGSANSFYNEYTDDMCWICLTLIHMSEALGDDKYANMARTMFDDYIEPRGWQDDDGFWGLPWKSNDSGRNACTNSPGCLVASKLYLKYGEEKYKQTAIKIAEYQLNEMSTKLNYDGRVEEPPLTYTQGTFGEACRQLYHITGQSSYLQAAQKIINYLCTSSRCTSNGLLRHEGTSMDQSIFKAVAIPYIVNMILDENVSLAYRRSFIRFLQKNAQTLWSNLDLSNYPVVYCNYYWGEPIDPSAVPSMGAMASGASLMENVARMGLALTASDDTGINDLRNSTGSSRIYSLDGRQLKSTQSLSKGMYVIGNKKVFVK